MQDRLTETYLGDGYYPTTYLFDDAGYMFDMVLFGGGPWFDREQLGNDQLIKLYIKND